MRRALLVAVFGCGGCGLFAAGEGDGGIEPTGADNGPTEGDMCPCVDDNEDIYVLSDDGEIWSFAPETRRFKFIMTVECGGMTDPFSMGVSRKGRAWIEYPGGELYTVDLKDPGAPCKDPGFYTDDPLFSRFGMAFVANGPSDRCDRLYAYSSVDPFAVGDDIGALAEIDPQTLQLSRIAPVDLTWGELSGTGDGRMFALEGMSPRILSEYDKQTGAVIDSWPLPQLTGDGAFAFAHWGGSFYFFTEPELFSGFSSVSTLELDDSGELAGEPTVVVEQTPIRIVGAGVSTCAPPCSAGRAACPRP